MFVHCSAWTVQQNMVRYMTRESLTSKSVVFKKNIWNIAYITKSGKLFSLPRIKSRQPKKTIKKNANPNGPVFVFHEKSRLQVTISLNNSDVWRQELVSRRSGDDLRSTRDGTLPSMPYGSVKMDLSPIAGFTFEILPFSTESWLSRKKKVVAVFGLRDILISI